MLYTPESAETQRHHSHKQSRRKSKSAAEVASRAGKSVFISTNTTTLNNIHLAAVETFI